MIGPVLALLLAASPVAEPPAPGSLDDCLAWTFAEMESGHARMERGALVIRRHLMMSRQFNASLDAGLTPAEALAGQRRLLVLGRPRMQSKAAAQAGEAARMACARDMPTPGSTTLR